MRDFYVALGHEPDYCTECGVELEMVEKQGYRRTSFEMDTPDHYVHRVRKFKQGCETAMLRITCHNESE